MTFLELLTKGSISDIINGRDIKDPIVQIVIFKSIKAQGVEKYRMILSDGVHSHSTCIINSAYNQQFQDGQIGPNCLVKLKRYTTSNQSGKVIILINELEIVEKGEKVAEVLGEPTSYKVAESQNITPSSTNATKSEELSPKKSKLKSSAIATFNKSVDSPSKKVHPISSLTPYQNRWSLRCRVTSKGNLKTYSNSRGSGKFFNFTLLDESGEIRCTAYNDECDRIFDSIVTGKIYQVRKCQIRPANRQYSSVNNDYEIVVTSDSEFLPQDDDENIPDVDFNFTQLAKIAELSVGQLVDIVGVIVDCGTLTNITSRKGKELVKRDIEIADDSTFKIRITLWGELASSPECETAKSVAIKNCKISDYGGRSLSTTMDAHPIWNPDLKVAYSILGWYERVKDEIELKDFKDLESLKSEQSMNSNNNASSILNLAQIRQLNSEGLDQPRYSQVLAHVSQIRYRENALYKGCSVCKKKLRVSDEDGQELYCDKCAKTPEDYNWNMILSIELIDSLDSIWATSFMESSEIIAGNSAKYFGELKDSDKYSANDIENMLHKNLFQPFLVKLKSTSEIYNDEQKIRISIIGIQAYNPVAYGYKLIQDIKSLKC